MTLRSILAAQQGEPRLAETLKQECAAGCLDPTFVRVLNDLAECVAADPEVAAWNRWIVRADDDRLIGTIGFLTRPDEHGELEIGYSIAPGEQGCGYATEAARAMISFAFSRPAVRCIRAMCHEDNQPSIKVLAKNGFTRTEDVGPMWGWRLDRANARPDATASH